VLVIHVDSVGLVLLRRTCRLCVVCEMLIGHEFEMDAAIDVTVDEAAGAMTDFKAFMRMDIMPRRRSRKSAADE
jgi:hypothetical protein